MYRINRFSLCLTAICLAVLAGCSTELPHESPYDDASPAAQQAKAEITGQVLLEGETDHAGVSIQLQGKADSYQIATESDGTFRLAGVTPGDYQLTVGTRYFQAVSEAVAIPLGKHVGLAPRRLLARRAAVTGKAWVEKLVASELAMAGSVSLTLARVASIRADAAGAPYRLLAVAGDAPSPTYTAISGEDGAYSFSSVPAGIYSLVAAREGVPPSADLQVTVTGEGEEVTPEEVVLHPVTGFFAMRGMTGEGPSSRFTKSTTVTLQLTPFNAERVAIGQSNSGRPEDCLLRTPVSLLAQLSHTFASEGRKTVCVRYLGDGDAASDVLVQSIVVDATPPAAPFLLVNGAFYRTSNLANVELGAVENGSGIAVMTLSESSDFSGAVTQPYNRLTVVPLSIGEGVKTLYAKLGDAAGNYSAVVSAQVVIDTTPPVTSLFRMEDDSGAPLSVSVVNQVMLQVDASDASPLEMMVSNRSDFAGAGWQTYQPFLQWLLPPPLDTLGESRVVYGKIRDAAGHVATLQTSPILLDMFGPANATLDIQGVVTSSTTVTVGLGATGADWVELSADIGFLMPVHSTQIVGATFDFAPGDGVKTLYARFGDAAGNMSALLSDSIVLDTTPPLLIGFTIDEGTLTRQSTLHLQLSAADAAMMQIREDTCGGAWIPFTAAVAYPLASTTPGAKVIAARLRDAVGNVTPCVSRNIDYDPAAPAFTSATPLLINSDDTYTTERSVTLQIAVTGATEVQIGESPALVGAAWVPHAPVLNWMLGPGEGSRQVYFRARDAAGNMTSIQNDGIVIDTLAPSFNSAAGPGLTNDLWANLALTAQDATLMRISADASFAATAWIPYAAATSFAITAGDGLKSIYIQVADAAGNQSLVRSVDLTLDQTAPAAPQVSALSGSFTRFRDITLQIVGQDAAGLLLSEAAPMTDATWQPYGLIKSFALAGPDGTKTVYVRLRDGAGNISPQAQVSVTLDTQAPVVTLFQAEDEFGAPLLATPQLSFTLRLTATDASPLSVQYGASNLFAGVTSEPYSATRVWSVPPPVQPNGETRSSYVRIVDAAGNQFVAGPVSVLVDTVAPTRAGITASRLVSDATLQLGLKADDAAWVETSADISFLAPQRFAMRAVTAYTLSGIEGWETVYARFSDTMGNYSPIVTTAVELDSQGPSGNAFSIDEAPLTPLPTVHLQLTALEAVEMQVSENGCVGNWVAYSSQAAYRFQSSLDAVKTIFVRFRDRAGNLSPCLSQSVTLDAAAPLVVSLSPRSGSADRVVTINGLSFGVTQGASRVWFGAVTGAIDAWSNTEIRARVPFDLSPGSLALQVVAGGKSSLPLVFNVLPRVIQSNPPQGSAGMPIALRGTNFGTAQNGGSVTVAGFDVPVGGWSQSVVTTAVPALLDAGAHAVVITAGGFPSNAGVYIVNPVLASLAPATSTAGATVLAQGNQFGASQGASEVLVGETPVDIISWSGSAIEFEAPDFPGSGTLPVSVRVNAATSNALPLHIQRPWISQFYPRLGTEGTLVTMTGIYFGAISGAVTFNGFPAVVSSWTENQVKAWVPAGLPAGLNALSLQTGANVEANRMGFQIRGGDQWIPPAEYIYRNYTVGVWTGSEILVWGREAGFSGARYTPATDSWLPMSPRAIEGDLAVWSGSEMLLWDTEGVQGARYDPKLDSWMSMNNGAGAPSQRNDSSAVWTGREMIVWGGNDYVAYQLLQTGARYNPFTDAWAPVTTASAPAARWGHDLVWTGKEMLVWGGRGANVMDPACSCLRMLQPVIGGRYDPLGDTWAPMSDQGQPSFREDFSAVWTGAEFIIWGGTYTPPLGGNQFVDTGGRYNPFTDTWSPMAGGPNAPSARSGHSAVWTGTEMVVWGGYSPSGSSAIGGRYNPSTDGWVAMSANPYLLYSMSPRITVWTGQEYIVLANDAGYRYAVTSDTWRQVGFGAQSPYVSTQHASTVVWTGSEMIVFGEGNGGGARFDPATDQWRPLRSDGTAPALRYGHAAVWTGNRMIVWGGRSYYSYISEGSRYDPATDAWEPMTTAGQPSGREIFTAVWSGTEMIAFGGIAGGYVSDGGRYDPATDIWSYTTNTNAPSGRFGHSAVWTGNAMIVWGGYSSGYVNSGGIYYPAGNTWTTLVVDANTPAGRRYHTAVWSGSEMIVWGGEDGSYPKDSGGRYSPASNAWTPTNLTGAPGRRLFHVSVWTGGKMLIWGGRGYTSWWTSPNDGAMYDPVSDGWNGITQTGAPGASEQARAVWTGTEAMVWLNTENRLFYRYLPE